MTPGRLLLFGFLVVIGVAGLNEAFGSATLPLRQRLKAAVKNAALAGFIFGVVTMMFASVVDPTVGALAGFFGYEHRREHDARQHRALAELVKLDETLVEPPVRGDPAARAEQEARKAKAEQERARVWKRFVKANERRVLPRWFTLGEAYVIVGAPLLFYAWGWTRRDEEYGAAPGGPPAAAAAKPDVRPAPAKQEDARPAPARRAAAPTVPAMSRGQAMEFWFWCWAAARERDRRIDPSFPTPVVAWRVSACLRIQAAFERLHRDGSCRARGSSDPLEERLTRGLDPVGVVLFDRYLVQQRRLWEERASAGADEEQEEAEIRASVVEAASRVFHRIVGATPTAIERGAAALPVATDERRFQAGLRMGGVLIYDEATEGPIPPEEEGPRWAEAIRRVHADGKELKS